MILSLVLNECNSSTSNTCLINTLICQFTRFVNTIFKWRHCPNKVTRPLTVSIRSLMSPFHKSISSKFPPETNSKPLTKRSMFLPADMPLSQVLPTRIFQHVDEPVLQSPRDHASAKIFQRLDLLVPQILKEIDKEMRLPPREQGSATICFNIDETNRVPAPHVVEQVFDVSVPQVDEQEISTQDQHSQQTVAQEIDEPLLKVQRALRVGDIVFVGRKSCRKLCSALATDTWKVRFGWLSSPRTHLLGKLEHGCGVGGGLIWSGGMKTWTAGSQI